MARVFFSTMWIPKTELGIWGFSISDKAFEGRPGRMAPHKIAMRKVTRNVGRCIDITSSHIRHMSYILLSLSLLSIGASG